MNNNIYSKSCEYHTLIYSNGVYYLFYSNILLGKIGESLNPEELYIDEFGKIFSFSFDDYYYSKNKQNTLKFIFDELTDTIEDFTSNKPIIMEAFNNLLLTLYFAFKDKDTNENNHMSFKGMVEKNERQYGKPYNRNDYVKFL